MEDVFTFNTMEVSASAEEKIVFIKSHGIAKSPDFRGAWDKGLELAAAHKCNKWLVDQKKQSIMPADQKWHEGEWFAKSMQMMKLDEENPRYVAVIPAENFFVEFSAKKFITQNTGLPGFEVAMFRNENDALEWLKTK